MQDFLETPKNLVIRPKTLKYEMARRFGVRNFLWERGEIPGEDCRIKSLTDCPVVSVCWLDKNVVDQMDIVERLIQVIPSESLVAQTEGFTRLLVCPVS